MVDSAVDWNQKTVFVGGAAGLSLSFKRILLNKRR